MDRGLYGQAIFFLTPEKGWLLVGGQPSAGNQPKELFSTTDGGMTWTHLSGSLSRPLSGGEGELGTAGYIGTLIFTSDQEGWLALAHVALMHTTDGGKHWTASLSAAEDRGDPSTAVHFVDARRGWTMTDYYLPTKRQTLWTTSDGGAIWQELSLPTAEP